MVVKLTVYSVLNSCTVGFINYSIILFTGLPLKGAIDKITVNKSAVHPGAEKKVEVGNNWYSFQVLGKFIFCPVLASLSFLCSFTCVP